MRIGIVGAGAIGGWMGIALAHRGHDVSALARGQTLEALRNGPWQLVRADGSIEASVRASDDAHALGVQDIVLLTVKGPALPGLAAAIRPLIGPETMTVVAMNGVPWWFLLAGGGELPPTTLKSVDPDGTIADAIPFSSVIGCVVHASASVPEPGRVAHKAGNRLIFGEPKGDTSERLETLAALFDDAGFATERSAHIQQNIWYKLWGNMTMNPISALTGATCGRILDDTLTNAFILRVMAEASQVGARIGCKIKERGEERCAVTRQLGDFKTSMLQDAEAGRPIELDQLLTAPREIAQMLAIATPNLDALLGLTRLFARSHGLYREPHA